jgi:hypothetical protein
VLRFVLQVGAHPRAQRLEVVELAHVLRELVVEAGTTRLRSAFTCTA